MSSNKWLIITLVVSLGANIALVGFFAGRASQFDLRPANLDPNPIMGFARILPELSPERIKVLRPLVGEHIRSVRPSVGAIRRAQRDLAAALLAEPFEPTRIEAALTEFREHLARSQVSSHAAFVELVEQLTPRERRLLVDGLGRNPRQHRFPPRNHPRLEDGG
ncbi:MAG: periplasmic heavy metal sensor [Pseudomonadales bacterium]|jgi:uncharacterized membrane protein